MKRDALVIGGGPAGAAAAILLAGAGWKVAVAEKAQFPRRKVCGEYISAAAWPLLARLGIESAVEMRAGPPVARVGFYGRESVLEAAMPDAIGAGRAIGRERLDTRLLERAAACGAEILQPCAVKDAAAFGARVVIAAHGSWEPGLLPTQASRRRASAHDLIGFKAHFRNASLPQGVMPLVLFPGGYGGLVHTDDARVSLSCCVRRSTLEAARAARPGLSAGESLLLHIVESNRGVREAIAGARRDGAWLAAGPIRPGIRAMHRGGAFVVGNAAGEAHPIVAEGISMAIQSAFLLCEGLVRAGPGADDAAHAEVGAGYGRDWRRNFAPRVHAAACFAAAMTRSPGARAAEALLARIPALLTLGAHWSGKDRALALAARNA